MTRKFIGLVLLLCTSVGFLNAQIVINEVSNINYSSILDEDGDSEDWIELFNAGDLPVDLFGYSLTDNAALPQQWTFPHYFIQPGEYLVVFCSAKDRMYTPPFVEVAWNENFVPQVGWNQHDFFTPFNWDGVSALVVNACSYSNTGYITNSIFNQTATDYISTISAFQDGSDASCSAQVGETHNMRPNMRFNGVVVGNGVENNGTTSYPAPYGNWYWGSRNQMIIRPEELTAAGLTAGPINSIAWDVAYTDAVTYTYIDVNMKQVSLNALTNQFLDNSGNGFHTNFKLNNTGETVFLFDPSGTNIGSLSAANPTFDTSVGLFPNATGSSFLFQNPTPGSANDGASAALGQAIEPVFSLAQGNYLAMQTVTIYDLNTTGSEIHFTINGDEPTMSSPLYQGESIPIFQSTALRARAFMAGYVPSAVASATYLINVSHTTPIISIITDNANLYGDAGIFDHWDQSWMKYAHMSYFDSTAGHPFLFERNSGLEIDGGAGGSRSQPQHSMRLKMNEGVFDGQAVNLPLISRRGERNKFSDLYLRNGSNMYLALPYKDASQVEMMAGATNSNYSAMRGVSVYINGQYFGLYEMREKFNNEMYEELDNATDSTISIMSLSYWGGSVLRAISGSVDEFVGSFNQFQALNELQPDYWQRADSLFDLVYLTDYIIGETWMGNTDWPQNNIKIYRSDATNYRWRFAIIDQELALNPGGWTDCNFDAIANANGIGTGNPFLGIWAKSMNNPVFRNYFINRYADVMNTAYLPERLLGIENSFFNEWVAEMPKEYARWYDPNQVNAAMNYFYQNHLTFQAELLCRVDQVRNHIEAGFGLADQVDLTLDVLPAGAGVIHISTITPTEYPWQGIYFNGVPIIIQAEANPGYQFVDWTENGLVGDVLDPTFTGEFFDNTASFVANFQTTIGVSEKATLSKLHVYPQPASSFLQVMDESSSYSSMEIMDTNGKKIKTIPVSGSTHRWTIDVQELPSGIYFLRAINVNGDVQSARFVKS